MMHAGGLLRVKAPILITILIQEVGDTRKCQQLPLTHKPSLLRLSRTRCTAHWSSPHSCPPLVPPILPSEMAALDPYPLPRDLNCGDLNVLISGGTSGIGFETAKVAACRRARKRKEVFFPRPQAPARPDAGSTLLPRDSHRCCARSGRTSLSLDVTLKRERSEDAARPTARAGAAPWPASHKPRAHPPPAHWPWALNSALRKIQEEVPGAQARPWRASLPHCPAAQQKGAALLNAHPGPTRNTTHRWTSFSATSPRCTR